MAGTHTLIGVGEGLLTALVVSSVLATRPDLVWGARHLPLFPAIPPPPSASASASAAAAARATASGPGSGDPAASAGEGVS
jgi:cobalt/nickel transport system permease protein